MTHTEIKVKIIWLYDSKDQFDKLWHWLSVSLLSNGGVYYTSVKASSELRSYYILVLELQSS